MLMSVKQVAAQKIKTSLHFSGKNLWIGEFFRLPLFCRPSNSDNGLLTNSNEPYTLPFWIFERL